MISYFKVDDDSTGDYNRLELATLRNNESHLVRRDLGDPEGSKQRVAAYFGREGKMEIGYLVRIGITK